MSPARAIKGISSITHYFQHLPSVLLRQNLRRRAMCCCKVAWWSRCGRSSYFQNGLETGLEYSWIFISFLDGLFWALGEFQKRYTLKVWYLFTPSDWWLTFLGPKYDLWTPKAFFWARCRTKQQPLFYGHSGGQRTSSMKRERTITVTVGASGIVLGYFGIFGVFEGRLWGFSVRSVWHDCLV